MPSARDRKWWLLLISYIFYAYWDLRFLVLLVTSSAVDYELGLMVEKEHDQRKRWSLLCLSLFTNLGTLFTFKYFDFFMQSFADMAQLAGVKVHPLTLNVVVPVGISFYTFHALSYIFDIYNRKIPACRSRLDFMLYVAFFPQLLAGPIVRARDFLYQMPEKKFWRDVPWQGCVLLFVIGLIKKVCFADNIGLLLEPVFEHPVRYTPLTLLLSGQLFAIQVYLDFSGYTDMAIATARMLGFVIPVNFYWPFLVSNTAEFWRRWHISLGSWFRDYVFLPLGGFSRNYILTLRNLLVSMSLIGLWHGSAFHYMMWGAWNGFGIWVYFVCRQSFGLSKKQNIGELERGVVFLAGMLATNLYVAASAYFFRMEDVPQALRAMSSMFGLARSGDLSMVRQELIIILSLLGLHVLSYLFNPTMLAHKLHPAVYGVIIGVLLAFYTLAMPVISPPFIYFFY